MIYMFCYDITDPKRLRKTAKLLENYGMRIQKSFFQCDLSNEKARELKSRLLRIINRKKDSLFVYPLCDKCAGNYEYDGNGEILKITEFEIL